MSNFQVSIVILKILFLHFHKVVEALCLGLLLHPEYHLPKLFALELIKLASSNETISPHYTRCNAM